MKRYCFLILILLFPSASTLAQKGQYLSVAEFHELAFPGQQLSWETLWVSKDQRASIESILDRRFPSVRVRYQGLGERTAWIFEEVGKELPITFGVVVERNAIADIRVLEYRESRGGEVRHPFFTRQFSGVSLHANGRNALNGQIDGITGATLSVRAMKKIATLALFCHQLSPFSNDESSQSTKQEG